ncbi:squalene/phytoene synthase family protein [Paracoccus benzoatiresistens]|uniref:Squalene/phytoene synthase family protein n=1 Tax=Paracoccus benzoatiresistens TaxID=2997341 RepID=A0ABT4JA34_9RHOB|nr:squalene/phytoene synthase family protein [Paracoccus sp. EF6]MCZ0963203.1 squalene/phytoene synthase family protein [Paracoccus sp. EF6]
MTLEACTELVRSQDPDRFGAVLVARPEDRPALITLYALNLEIARAPLQSDEPMLAEMRLQWWIDRLAEMGTGKAPPLHDVLTPLWEVWGKSAGQAVPLAEARRRDCEREPLAGPDAVVDYVTDTAGRLMGLAAERLGAPAEARRVVADQALGAGLAAWLRALPRLQPLRLGLDQPRPADAVALAGIARDALRRAARARHLLPRRATAALYPGPRVLHFLAGVLRGDINCFSETPDITEFQRRAALAGLALTGRWWR